MAVAVLQIIKNALAVHNVYSSVGEAIKPADVVYVLGQLNTIFDDWNADGQTSVAGVISPFITTGVQPVTIGPTGTWVLPVRPVKIDGATIAFATGINTPLTVHDDPQWWIRQPQPALGSMVDAYYSPGEPNGSFYFANLPAAGLTVQLLTRRTLAAVLSTDTLVLAPGYQSALELTLAEAIADAFHATVSASLATRAGKARARAWKNNLRVPTLSTAGLGLPGSSGGWWDYRTGTMRTRG